jgi:hypothetical protein
MSKKRKRETNLDESLITDDNLAPKHGTAPYETEVSEAQKILNAKEVINVQKKIFHAVKETSRALNKARDFEVRKIIKRLKSSKYSISCLFCLIARQENESGKVLRLEKELQIAKVLPRNVKLTLVA